MAETQFSYKSKRNDLLYDIVEGICDAVLSTYYKISYENADRLNDLREEGFVLLPKHQRYIDIPLEGTFLKKIIGRRAYYIMSSSLPRIFEKLGGIGLTRVKDIRKKSDRRDRKEALDYAQKQKRYVEDVIQYLLERKEIVVIHPEGQRNYKKTASPKKAIILRKLFDIQKRMRKPITFIPLDIFYKSGFRPLSSIVLKVGSPIQTNDVKTLEDHLINEIELFSRDT